MRSNSWKVFGLFWSGSVSLRSPIQQSKTFSRKSRGTSSMQVWEDFR